MAPHKPHVIGFQSAPPQTPTIEGFGKRRVRSGKTPVAYENLEEETQRLLKEDRDALLRRLAKSVGFYYLPMVNARAGKEFQAPPPPDFMMASAEILPIEADNYNLITDLSAGVISLHDAGSGFRFFPAFQWQDGHLHPHVAPVVKALRAPPLALSDWQIFAWFASSNGWLRGDAPIDRLGDLDALLYAAKQEQFRMED